jgi:hypothetical protein
MRALSFFFALMVGLALAFFAPAMAGGRAQAPEAMVAPEAAGISSESADLLASDGLSADQLTADLLAELTIDGAPALDASV